MKKNYLKKFGKSMAAVLIVTTMSGGMSAFASTTATVTSTSNQAADTKLDELTIDAANTSALLDRTNAARKDASKSVLVKDQRLDEVAYAYADILYKAGADFRKTTDFRTLPNGKKVRYLVSNSDVTGLDSFYYSTFFYANTLETTKEYKNQAVNGDYTNIGIAYCTGSDGFKVVVFMFSKE